MILDSIEKKIDIYLWDAPGIKELPYHMLKRRQLIKTLAAGTAGIWVSSHFISCQAEPGVKWGTTQYTQTEIDNLYAISKSIVPKLDSEMFRWLTTYISDCFSPEKQQQFREGYNQFHATFMKGTSKVFSSIPANQQIEILQSLEKENKEDSSLSFFYQSLKTLSIQSYTGSKIFLTQVRPYVHVPGRYLGCVPV
jgi:hypothetical protein